MHSKQKYEGLTCFGYDVERAFIKAHKAVKWLSEKHLSDQDKNGKGKSRKTERHFHPSPLMPLTRKSGGNIFRP